jgi:hypothetical protein
VLIRLIGVISKENQGQVVEEFFELFKTPWEAYKPGRRYEVLVATADDLPDVSARLLLVYGCQTSSIDARQGVVVRARHRGARVCHHKFDVPIYGELATFEQVNSSTPVMTASAGVAGLRSVSATGDVVIRIGYDLFEEVRFLLTSGQPGEYARIPTLDLHIAILRNWILNEGLPVLEIAPSPAGHPFAVCLTHDIDFVGIRNHKLDHTMWGFLLRSTFGAALRYIRRRISIGRLLDSWRAAASLPFVYLGWTKDFWAPFQWYLQVEKGLPATYFLIPFKGREGERVPGRHAYRRAAAYEVTDLKDWMSVLKRYGCELGVHGIDSWHNVEKGRSEAAKISELVSGRPAGIRIHWLLQDSQTPLILEESGYAYDSTSGYNETIGYRNGTTQVFRPLGVTTLLELPLNIQDGALFYRHNLNLTNSDAQKSCERLLANSQEFGGVLTLVWHDRSHAAERFWGDFYLVLIRMLKSSDAWFASGTEAVAWFRKRRQVRFERKGTGDGAITVLRYDGQTPVPSFKLRVYSPTSAANRARRPGDWAFVDILWRGEKDIEFDPVLNKIPETGEMPASLPQ